jgi:hypothetical protein
MSLKPIGALVNVLNFSHPHVKSLFSEGLWGFPDNTVNRKRWNLLETGCTIFFYGNYNNNKGVYLKGNLKEKFESHEPVKYWVQNPIGYPLQIRVDILGKLEEVTPVLKGELVDFGVKVFRALDRWSLLIFGDIPGATYSFEMFKRIEENYEARNKKIPYKTELDHETVKDLIHQIGLLQEKISIKEIELDGYKIDVAWKRLQRADPYIVFEVHIRGNLEEALTKLKHARDMWNAKPILVTTRDQTSVAYNIASGAFHEIIDELKIITLEEINALYEKKKEFRSFESKLGLH